jgi:pimeloyl-ACP methyl ester carboxylesterase
MEGLADRFKVVAIDQRGYNRSDKPDGQVNYGMQHLVGDVEAVINHLGEDSATIVGHDWGGAVAWQFAFALPQMVDNLVILNLPHPNGMAREMAGNAEQQANSNYARVFIEGSPSDLDIFFGGPMTAETLAGWVSDVSARERYVEAFRRSDFDAMLSYYKQNYPGGSDSSQAGPQAPQLNIPLLVFHGLEDTALHSNGLNNTWDWNDSPTTVVAVPGAGHFVQQDAAAMVTNTLRWWLLAKQQSPGTFRGQTEQR